ncbi:cysteine desulfurase NifS [Candidatus Woesearchaeota archaeon]|nr:cysteine desulfurase NifS [Candidatus Woesearchaeota archaeon]
MKVYLDNGATTMVDPAVVKVMLPFFTEKYGNPSSIHQKGQEAKQALAEAREVIAGKLNASYDEIIFTSGGTESDNLAIRGAAIASRNKGNHIITTKIEHPAVLRTCEALEKEGFTVTYLGVDREGFVVLDELKKAITPKTILVSIIHGNNEIGTIQPLDEIGAICREKGILFHTDAVQSFTKVQINVKKTPVDLISVSSHKIHGPKGVGALYIRKGTKIEKLAHGGGHEFKLRAGTENVPGIVGFAKAVKLMSDSDAKKTARMRDMLIAGIEKEISDVKLNGPRGDPRLCNNVNIAFASVEGEALGSYLDVSGVCTSTGSACTSHSLQPSHVLLAIGIDKELANGTLRMTLSRFTTEEEVDYTVKMLKKYVEKLRKISPLKRVLGNVL